MNVFRSSRTAHRCISSALRRPWTPRRPLAATFAVHRVPADADPPLQQAADNLNKDDSSDNKLIAESIFGRQATPELQDTLDHLTRSEPHHLHVFCTKHNTHLTLSDPARAPIISKSTGNIGFRKANRGTYDAAYQLTAYVLSQIYEGGTLGKIARLEVIFRGFGIGREAVGKALTGVEGRRIRDKIVRVTDSTRLKFGGSRSKKPRRLG